MAIIRRGFAFGASGDPDVAPRANDGSIESRNGSDNAMPVPRRKRRRDIGRRVEMYGAKLGAAEFVFMGLRGRGMACLSRKPGNQEKSDYGFLASEFPSSAFLRVSWFPAQTFISVVKLCSFKASSAPS